MTTKAKKAMKLKVLLVEDNADDADLLRKSLAKVASTLFELTHVERLEEALQICLQMWGDDEGPFEGRHSHLARTLNSPQPLSRPHPPILIGGSGEKKTLRLVARYAQACNLFGGPDDVKRKFEVLRAHCEAEGRPYDEIQKTVGYNFDVGENGERVGQTIEDLKRLAAVGVQVAHGRVQRVWELTPLEVIGKEVFPAVADL